MAAVFHFDPSYRRTHRDGRASSADRLPALLRETRWRPAGAGARPESVADAWRALENRARRLIWLGVSVVVAADLFATFVLHVR